jgi:hypothetical protein
MNLIIFVGVIISSGEMNENGGEHSDQGIVIFKM